MLLFYLACTPKSGSLSESIPSVPIIPAPHAQNYAVQGNPPKDPLVARIASGFSWNEALSGAAAELGLENSGRTPLLSDARWSAVMAGFPYQVSQMIIGDVDMDETPIGLSETLQALQPKQLGLVRVRKGTMDRWVALIGEDGSLTESFPREVELGGAFKVEGTGTWRLADPSGNITSGELPIDGILGMEGEWWLEIKRGTVYSSIPIYVGIGTPVSNLFVSEEVGLEIERPSEVEEDALILIEEMRNREGLVPLQYDKMLVSLAQYPLKYYLEGSWNRGEGVEHLQKAGFVGGPTYQLACQAESALACLDDLSWEIESRQALLDPQIRNIGISTYVDTSKVALLINLSSE